jgi:hypothetical protein
VLMPWPWQNVRRRNMSLLKDYIGALELDLVDTQALVAGGEDSLDIAAGESTLSPEAVARQTEAFADLKARRDWIVAVLALLKEGDGKGFDAVKLYNVDPELLAEVRLKHEQMARFRELFRPTVIGADALVIVEREAAPETNTAAAQKKAKKA